jgi:hypothetical protein
MVEEQINVEHARFEKLIEQLNRERERKLEDLKVQLQAVNRLLEVATWQHNVSAAVALADAAVAAAEVSANTTARLFYQSAPGHFAPK